MHPKACAQLKALRADHRVSVGEAEHAVLKLALHKVVGHKRLAAENDVAGENLIAVAVAAEVVDAQAMALAQTEDELHPPLIETALQSQITLCIHERSGHPRRGIQLQVDAERGREKSSAQREMIRDRTCE